MVNNYSIISSLQNYGRKLAKRRKSLPREAESLKKRCRDFKDKFLHCLGDFPEKSVLSSSAKG